MHSNDELSSLHSFLMHTPEGALRKMLIGGQDLTDLHFRILVKLAKGGSESDFIQCFEAENFGSLRLSPKESAVSENFWPIIKAKLKSLGLIGVQKAA